MRFAFKELPGRSGDSRRPVVPVSVEGLERVPLFALVDTGSLQNRFGRWVAEAAGINLEGADRERIGLGGFASIEGLTVPVRLAIEDAEWEAPVSFCDPWPFDFQLLGQEGFFRWFRVLFRAADAVVEVTLEER